MNKPCTNISHPPPWFPKSIHIYKINKFWVNQNVSDSTWTQRAITSANRERDLTGYNPFIAGSTILANASISWSWGVAHRTKDCSDLGLELSWNVLQSGDRHYYIYIISISAEYCSKTWEQTKKKTINSPIKWFPSAEKFQHDNSKAVDITFQSILTRQGNFRCIISRSNIMIQYLNVRPRVRTIILLGLVSLGKRKSCIC